MLNGHTSPEENLKRMGAVVLEMDNPDHRAKLANLQAGLKPKAHGKTAKPSPFGVDAGKLQNMVFPAIRFTVPGLLPEGLTILAGKPKLGKSWLTLGLAVSVATGGIALGSIPVDQGDVLYLGLEDGFRRLQGRLQKILPYSKWPDRLTLGTECSAIGGGCVEALEGWIGSAANPRLIVIDTLARIRPASKASESLYANDYAAIQPLQELAGRHNISIIVVHHTRKSEADDPFDTISGSLGLTGSADNLWVLAKQGEITRLIGRGRDLEDFDKAVKFLPVAGAWEIIGDAGSMARTQERQTVLDAIREAGEPIGARDIAAETGGREGNIRRLLPKLVKEGLIEKVSYGKYTVPGNTGNTGNTSDESGGNADLFEGESVTAKRATGNTSTRNKPSSVTGVTASVTGTTPAKPWKQPSVTSVTGKRQGRTDLAQICAKSQAEAAELLNVSRRSVQSARKVLNEGIPELIEAVEQGEIAVSKAAKIAELPKPQQMLALKHTGDQEDRENDQHD